MAQTASGISPLFQQDRIGRLRPVAVWRQAFGKVWNDALAHWLAIHLPGGVVLPEGYDPGESSRPKPEARSGAGGDPSDAFRTFAHRDEVRGEGVVMQRR